MSLGKIKIQKSVCITSFYDKQGFQLAAPDQRRPSPGQSSDLFDPYTQNIWSGDQAKNMISLNDEQQSARLRQIMFMAYAKSDNEYFTLYNQFQTFAPHVCCHTSTLIAMGCDDVTFILITNTLRHEISKSISSSTKKNNSK